MSKYYYDLHMHSCLSPCGDGDMTPANIAAMAQLKELDIIALTDHNSCKNCPALMESIKGNDILALSGMEINTAEEIHAVCLFKSLDRAMDFDEYVYGKVPNIINRTDIFGEQSIVDKDEEIIGHVDKLLISAADIGITELKKLVSGYGGVCFPAHIDKSSYSVISVLGTVPDECGFNTVEISRPQLIDKVLDENPNVRNCTVLTNSDAHYLWDISERYHYIELEEKSIECLFDKIR